MPTPLTDAINALTTYANETTGASDTTLSDAVETLVDGYGQGGGGYDIDTICTRSYTGDITTNADTIKSYTFDGSHITYATGNNVDSVSAYAFRGCNDLVSVNFPVARNIEEYAFNNCTNLLTVNAPNITWLAQHAFNGCKKLQHAHFPNLVNFNGNYVFASCQAIDDLYFPKSNASTSLSYYARYATMENVVLPSMTAIVASNAFRNCPNLKRFDSATNQIGNNNNFDLSKLDTMILRRVDNICILAGTNNFSGTPFASNGTGGTIYVPQALKATYEANTNWATILSYPNNSIETIEGSYYETHYANGELLPTYTEVTGVSKIDNKSLNDTGGIGSNNSCFITDFIETGGCLDWMFVCSASFNSNYCNCQAFNGDEFIVKRPLFDNPKRIIDGVTLNAWRILLPSGTTKFRFSGTKANIDAQPFHLYKEIWS